VITADTRAPRRRRRLSGVAVALVGTVGVVAAGGCGLSRPHPSATASQPQPSTEAGLRSRLLTQADLPAGFTLEQIPAHATAGATASPAGSAAALAGLGCTDLIRNDFVTFHDPPLADVESGVERKPKDSDQNDYGFFGHENIDLYAAGQASAAMSAIRTAAGRCHSFTDTNPDATYTLTVTDAKLGTDDGLILNWSIMLSGDDAPMAEQRGYLRSGDVIISVGDEAAYNRPASDDVKVILAPAWAVYRRGAAAS
jgi:hypothetical protein